MGKKEKKKKKKKNLERKNFEIYRRTCNIKK